LEESGYQSILARSQHAAYGTGWLMADNVSVHSDNSADDWGITSFIFYLFYTQKRFIS
jgi:hypothetical protein